MPREIRCGGSAEPGTLRTPCYFPQWAAVQHSGGSVSTNAYSLLSSCPPVSLFFIGRTGRDEVTKDVVLEFAEKFQDEEFRKAHDVEFLPEVVPELTMFTVLKVCCVECNHGVQCNNEKDPETEIVCVWHLFDRLRC